MTAANTPTQRPPDARLLVVFADGRISHLPRSRFVDLLDRGDLVVANDAATLPASLHGVHVRSGAAIEVRLAGRASLRSDDVRFSAVVFGTGDFRTRTEDRALPPVFRPGDRLVLHGMRVDGDSTPDASALTAMVEAVLGHARLVRLRFSGPSHTVWAGLARYGRPIQYAHMPETLAMWDVWTPIAAMPVAFEPPSAGFAIDWAAIQTMRARGVAFATITLAAGISSTGDDELDRRLPFDEPYRIPAATAAAVRRTLASGGRIVAVGTTVVRALEHAAEGAGIVRAGDGVANQRLSAASELRIVDAILSGTHEPASSHYQLLRAFQDGSTLADATAALEIAGYRTHEFGDSMWVEKGRRRIEDWEIEEMGNRFASVPGRNSPILQFVDAKIA
jgi:S-adenosylmethionine:tRNA ribosyltransferase-isomerase